MAAYWFGMAGLKNGAIICLCRILHGQLANNKATCFMFHVTLIMKPAGNDPDRIVAKLINQAMLPINPS